MTDNAVLDDDPWAWLHTGDDADGPAWADVSVTAVITPVPDGDVERCRRAVEAGDVTPDHLMVDDPDPASAADWLWLLTGESEPAPGALRQLLVALERHPGLDVVGPLLVAPRRRGPGTVIAQFGQTVSSNGRLRGLVPSGELYQGQLEFRDALGVDATGMLVRGEVWRELGGFTPELPAGFRGLDFGWRATLAGHEVAVEPSAQVVNHAESPDLADARAAGLTLVAAHARPGRRFFRRLRLVIMSLLAMLGFLVGKDGARALAELKGLARWLGGRDLRRAVASRVHAIDSTPESRQRARALLPPAGSGLRRAFEGLAERGSEWLATFSGPADSPSLDELTGDEFAGQQRAESRVSPLAVGAVLTTLLAVAAARALFGAGSLQGPWLLPAPAGWFDLLTEYVSPIPGQAALNAPAWQGLAALASFVTGGQPEWLVSLLLMACVPLAWLAAFRLLSQTVASRAMAGVAAFCYAMAPAVIGALNEGAVGVALFAVLLPVLVYRLRSWQAEPETTWRGAAGVGIWGLIATALLPLAWPVLLVVLVVLASRRRSARSSLQLLLAALAPLLVLVGPWRDTLLAYPGRLLTGIEPTMTGTAAPQAWEVLLGRTVPGVGPWWVSAVVLGGLWIGAVLGALRRGGAAALALAVAALGVVAALGLTRLVVMVPPGEWARPSGLEWLVLAIGGLVAAAAWGLDDLASELRGANLGFRHVGTLALAVLMAGVVALSGGWWVLAGAAGLERAPVTSLPPFVRNSQTSPTPGRTLALEVSGEQVRWSLLQDDGARFGDPERGLVASGSAAATTLADSVVRRLASGTADDKLLPDLRRLGISYIWLTGGDAAVRLAISNTPGLGVGTGDTDTVWPVAGAGRAVVVTGEDRLLTGNGQRLEGGDRLELAEPADARWQASVGDRALQPADAGGFGQSFAIGGASGTLTYSLRSGPPWWAWVQLAGLVVLLVLAAPGLRRGGEPAAPRRAEAPVPEHVDVAPRRLAGDAR